MRRPAEVVSLGEAAFSGTTSDPWGPKGKTLDLDLLVPRFGFEPQAFTGP